MTDEYKVTDEMIEDYCRRMNYTLKSIGSIAFSYRRKDDERIHILLKSAAYDHTLAMKNRSTLENMNE